MHLDLHPRLVAALRQSRSPKSQGKATLPATAVAEKNSQQTARPRLPSIVQ